MEGLLRNNMSNITFIGTTCSWERNLVIPLTTPLFFSSSLRALLDQQDRHSVNDAIDLCVALLVKVFPLARVATSYCCDGHGIEPAQISFQSDWDFLWGKAVFKTLFDAKLNSKWGWTSSGNLQIEPQGEYDDVAVLNMLNDIQNFARLLLNRQTINKISLARVRTLDVLGNQKPTSERFGQEAHIQLSEQFYYY